MNWATLLAGVLLATVPTAPFAYYWIRRGTLNDRNDLRGWRGGVLLVLATPGLVTIAATISDWTNGTNTTAGTDTAQPDAPPSPLTNELRNYVGENFGGEPWRAHASSIKVSGHIAVATLDTTGAQLFAQDACFALSGWVFSNLNTSSVEGVRIEGPSGAAVLTRDGIGDRC
jgi:hypothetical protein